MSDLLLELFSEEIPARMQTQAAVDLRKIVTDALVERGLLYEGAASFATPRRLALHIAGLPARQPDTREEKKGPRVGAPEAAIQGFLKSAGLASIDQATIQKDPKKGDFYVAVIERPGAETIDILAEIIPATIRNFPWPKSMCWGADSMRPDALRWVRPLHSILATFGPETESPDIVRFAVNDIRSGDETKGHRFMAPGTIRVKRFDDYVPALERAKVVLDAGRRREIILADARTLAMAQGLELVEDPGLLEEVAGLVEWPVALMGSFNEEFLSIPKEVIRATIRVNQKCFVLKKPDGALANRFILVSNIEAIDGGATIIAGNERPIAARLSDAKFFYETDLKTKLDERLPKLESIVFHEKLGTQMQRVERIMALAGELAPLVGAEPAKAERAAKLCKADLVTEMVGEFPELQGLMGRYYAAAQGEDESVAAACEEHYKPQGPSDRIPTDPVSVSVALADKIDTLVGFWAIDEKPTGSKDPYALRRAALGVIRLVLENGLRLRLLELSVAAMGRHSGSSLVRGVMDQIEAVEALTATGVASDALEPIEESLASRVSPHSIAQFTEESFERAFERCLDLLNFFIDRLKVYLRDRGARYDLIDAALGATSSSGEESQSQDELALIVARVEALSKFLDTEDGRNLLAGFRRAVNILKIEEKKDGAGAFDAPHVPGSLVEPAEFALSRALNEAREETRALLAKENFEGAMTALSRLRTPVDAFFDDVTVNTEDSALRSNRLCLLNELRRAMLGVADFGKVAGEGA